MGYIKVVTKGTSVSLHFDGEMVIFAVLSVLLLLFTGGTWGFLEWRRRERQSLALYPAIHPNAHVSAAKGFIP